MVPYVSITDKLTFYNCIFMDKTGTILQLVYILEDIKHIVFPRGFKKVMMKSIDVKIYS